MSYLIDFIDRARTVQGFPYLGKKGGRAVERVFKLIIFKLTVSKL